MQQQHEQKFIRLSGASERLGVSKSTLYRLLKTDPAFPRLIKIGRKCSAFDAEALDAWARSRVVD